MACVGGTSVSEDQQRLKAGVQVVVGTPGRVKHMIDNKDLSLEHLKCFILDEADEMLSRGFQEQIYSVIGEIGHRIQVGLFSATLEDDTLQIAEKFMDDPIMILVKKNEVTLEGIAQFYFVVEEKDKYQRLTQIYNHIQINQCIIYVNKKTKAEMLGNKMADDFHTVACIHSDIDDTNRRRIMNEFRLGNYRVLISTNISCRGIDVHGVSHVINFDFPLIKETYIHRIGRGGRFGRKGIAINFVTPDEQKQIKELEDYYTTTITELNPSEIGASS